MKAQTTLKTAVSLSGIALHSGDQVRVTIYPAAPNQGITFLRSDLEGSPPIPAHFKNVVSTKLATTLGRGKATVSTVEHLMAALHGVGIDNATVEVSGAEIPILDGSAEPFRELLQSGGVQLQLQARPTLVLRRRVEVRVKEKWAAAEPAQRLEIDGSIEWDHPAIGYQRFHYVEGRTPFSELSSARTFGFLGDVEGLRRMGLAKGASLESAVVLDDAAVVNPGGLRFADEFARHKVLDALGDLKLAGIGIQAYIRLHRAGHDLHSQLLTEIFRDADNFEILDHSVREEGRVAALRAALAGSFAASV